MGSYGPAETRPRGLGQFTPVLTPAPGRNECCWAEGGLARVSVCARGLSVHECANMRVRVRVHWQWCWGGCRRASFVEPLAGSEPAWRLPLLVPGGHLVLLHSPYLSVPCRSSTFLGGRSAPAFGCWQPRPRGPAQVNAAAPAWALPEGGRKGRAGKGVLPFAPV